MWIQLFQVVLNAHVDVDQHLHKGLRGDLEAWLNEDDDVPTDAVVLDSNWAQHAPCPVRNNPLAASAHVLMCRWHTGGAL